MCVRAVSPKPPHAVITEECDFSNTSDTICVSTKALTLYTSRGSQWDNKSIDGIWLAVAVERNMGEVVIMETTVNDSVGVLSYFKVDKIHRHPTSDSWGMKIKTKKEILNQPLSQMKYHFCHGNGHIQKTQVFKVGWFLNHLLFSFPPCPENLRSACEATCVRSHGGDCPNDVWMTPITGQPSTLLSSCSPDLGHVSFGEDSNVLVLAFLFGKGWSFFFGFFKEKKPIIKEVSNIFSSVQQMTILHGAAEKSTRRINLCATMWLSWKYEWVCVLFFTYETKYVERKLKRYMFFTQTRMMLTC